MFKAATLRKPIYELGSPIFVTVDISPIGIGWVINQESEDEVQYSIQFGTKILSERQ
mgnify:CR=1 FL=1